MDNLEKIFKERLGRSEMQTSNKVWKNISKALIRQRRIKYFLIYFFSSLGIALLIGLAIYLTRDKASQQQLNNNSTEVLATNHRENFKNNQTKNTGTSFGTSQNKNEEVVSENLGQTREIADINSENKNFNRLAKNQSKSKQNYFIPAQNNINLQSKTGNQNQIIASSYTLNSLLQKRTKYTFSRLLTVNPKPNLEYSKSGRKKIGFFQRHQTGILNDCFSDRGSNWFVDVYLSPDYAKKYLTGPKPEYISSRLASESALLSYSGGIMGGYKFSNNLLIKGGINYTRINEKFHLIKKNVTNTKVHITIDTIWITENTYEIQRDTTIEEIYGTKEIQKINKYSMIDIPLIFGYQMNHNDFNLGINAGVILNILSFQKGKMLNMEGEIKDFNGQSDDPNIFNKNLGLSIYTSAYLGYRINKNLEFFAEPKFRYFLKPFTNTNYPLSQKYSKFGISFGPRYFFN